jgi:hypothetical protein
MRIARAGRDVARRRPLLAALAVALVGAQGVSLAHFAIVKHAYCAEHGEIIELRAEPAHPGGHTHAGKLPGLYAAYDSSESGHDHCLASAHRRDAAISPPACAITLNHGGLSALPPSIAWSPSSPDRFRLAPKQSPPA